MTFNFDSLTSKCQGTFFHHPDCMYEIWKLYIENYSSYRVRTKVLTKYSCDLGPLDPKMYRILPLAILYLCMKYERCTLKTTQVIVSEPKCWQSSVVTLTFGVWTPKCIGKCIGIFLLPSCIYVWKLYIENYSSYHVRTSVDGQTDRRRERQTDTVRQSDDPNTRCPWLTFQAGA